MTLLKLSAAAFVALILTNCVGYQADWRSSVDQKVAKLGYRNWIVIAEASFPAHSRKGVTQVSSEAEIPVVMDYVLNAMESTQHVRPKVYLTRELHAVENDFAPGIDTLREQIKESIHGHEPTILDQQSLLTLIESATQNFDVLVIRTPTALPYSSIFLELQPGYWDADSETRLRDRIRRQQMESLASPTP
ncbi:MAG: RbsD/FucU domain-containing protein [Akkermansiaceae bacterium]